IEKIHMGSSETPRRPICPLLWMVLAAPLLLNGQAQYWVTLKAITIEGDTGCPSGTITHVADSYDPIAPQFKQYQAACNGYTIVMKNIVARFPPTASGTLQPDTTVP